MFTCSRIYGCLVGQAKAAKKTFPEEARTETCTGPATAMADMLGYLCFNPVEVVEF